MKIFPFRPAFWATFLMIFPIASWGEVKPINSVTTHFISRTSDPNPQYRLGGTHELGSLTHGGTSWGYEGISNSGCLIYGPYERRMRDRKGHLGGWIDLQVSSDTSVMVDIVADLGRVKIWEQRVGSTGGQRQRIDIPLKYVIHADLVELRVCDIKTKKIRLPLGGPSIQLPGSVHVFETGLIFNNQLED